MQQQWNKGMIFFFHVSTKRRLQTSLSRKDFILHRSQNKTSVQTRWEKESAIGSTCLSAGESKYGMVISNKASGGKDG